MTTDEILDKYIHVIKNEYPDIEREDIKIGQGWDFIALLLPDVKKVFRFPRNHRHEDRFFTEVSFLKEFSKYSPVAVPVWNISEDKDIGPYMAGFLLEGIPFTENLISEIPKENLLLLAKDIAEFLSKLHSFPQKEAKLLGVQETVSFIDKEKKRWEETRNLIWPHVSNFEKNWLEDVTEKYFTEAKGKFVTTFVIHRDLHQSHILIDPNSFKLSGVIDFSDVLVDDSALDFIYLSKYGKEFEEVIYKNYGLPIDDFFRTRVQFYRNIKYARELFYALKGIGLNSVERSKESLSDYIQKSF